MMADVLKRYKELLIQKEKYTQLLLSHQIRGITTIDDTHKLAVIRERRRYNEK